MSDSIGEITKSGKKRPPVTGTPVLVRLQPEDLAAVDAWRKGQPDIPTRAEALRRLMALGLKLKR